MADPATIVRDETRRETAELGDDRLVRPPQVYVRAPEGTYGDVIQAVARAIGENPCAVDGPAVMGRDDDEFGALTLTFRPNELPVMGDGRDPEPEGWLPPYRAEEQVREALLDELPDGWSLETQRQGRLVLYEE